MSRGVARGECPCQVESHARTTRGGRKRANNGRGSSKISARKAPSPTTRGGVLPGREDQTAAVSRLGAGSFASARLVSRAHRAGSLQASQEATSPRALVVSAVTLGVDAECFGRDWVTDRWSVEPGFPARSDGSIRRAARASRAQSSTSW